MASYVEILEILAPETGPVPAATIANKLNTKVNTINTQLLRMVDRKWLNRDEEANYSITEEGRKQINPPTEESEKTTEFQQFITFGQRIGVTPDAVTLAAEHVWRGGDYKDLNWVWTALTEQGVRSDLAKRWWHNWRSYLHQAVPPELEKELGPAKTAAAAEGEAAAGAKAAAESKGKRDYILGADDLPLQVGEGAGDMDYTDAVQLSKLKLAAQARAAALAGGKSTPQEQVSFIEAVANAFKTFKEATGGNGAAKPLVITQGKDGVKIQEVETGTPVVLESSGGNDASRNTWVVEPDGTARQLKPGEPVVIKQPAPTSAGGNHEPPKYYYIKPDGSYEEKKAGEPIIIKQEAPPTATSTFLNATTPDGKPIVIDIESYFKLEDHKAKQERDKESHDVKMDTLKAIKDLVVKGGRALGHVGEE